MRVGVAIEGFTAGSDAGSEAMLGTVSVWGYLVPIRYGVTNSVI